MYLVRRGDTLWAIAERMLGGEASAVEVARLVERIWELNAASIGTGSPDMIRPGQQLRLPRS
jgi:nucleoid-associated protein YgaU